MPEAIDKLHDRSHDSGQDKAQDRATDRLRVLLDSSTPIVVMETVEESRAVRLVRIACQSLNLQSFEWTIASGLVRSGMTGSVVAGTGMAASAFSAGDFGIERGLPPGGYTHDAYAAAQAQGNMIYDTRDPAKVLGHMEGLTVEGAFILKDFHRHLEDPVVVRRLRDVGQKFQTNRRTLILTAPSLQIPPELASLVEYLELPLPDRVRLRQIVDEMLVRVSKTHTLGRKLDAAGIEAVVANLRGLTEEESERAVSQALVTRYALCPETITDILDAKKAMLKRTGMLDFVDTTDSMAGIGGLENLKNWLALRRGAWEEKARDFGLEPPKGVIILGVQGCGKSLCARAIAGEWQLPLVKFDSSAIFDKYIGETEKRIRKVFKVAEGLAPCVLWIDELEKVFAGTGADSASVDAGVSSRMLGSFLGWMQDRKAPVFVAATSNNVNALPPELIRKGRFDELFFVDLPNQAERKQILSIQLARRKKNVSDFDLEQIAQAAGGYSGAEIDAAVQTAMYASFSFKQPMTTQTLLDALSQTVPLSATRAEDIQALRNWAKARAVPASAAIQES